LASRIDREASRIGAAGGTVNKSRALVIAGLGLAAVFLWLALRKLDVGATVATLAEINPLGMPPFLLALAAFCWFKAARWSTLLAPVVPATTRQLLAPIVVGYAGTTLMPMQMGELVRAYVASRTVGIRIAAALASIVLERLLDVLVLLAILGAVLSTGARLDTALGRVGLWLLGLSALGIAFMGILVFRPQPIHALLDRLGRRLPGRVSHFLREQFTAVASGFAALRRPAAYARIVAASALQWSCMLACVSISLWAVGLELAVPAAMAVLATTLLGMSLPAGPGYVGTIQVAFLVALKPFGVDSETAIAASLFYHALLCIPLLIWGAGYAASLGLTWRELRPTH
jgi:hypothetical protein